MVATPIGNLEDMTARALRILTTVAGIYCEDTRHAGRLLAHFAIQSSLRSYHQHNEKMRTQEIVDKLQSGQSLALISDAGTPVVSDPGLMVVQAVLAADLPVQAVPGCSALTASLQVSGLPAAPMQFFGFLPAKEGEKREAIARLRYEDKTSIYYESPHRIAKTLQCFAQELPQRELVLVKELTKIYETRVAGTAEELCNWLAQDAKHAAGEFVLLVAPSQDRSPDSYSVTSEQLLSALSGHLPPKKVAAIASNLTGIPKNKLYEQLLLAKS